MPSIKSSGNLDNLESLDQLKQYVSIYLSENSDVCNGNLEFGLNIKSSLISCTFSAVNSDQKFSHALGKTPNGYFIVGKSANMNVYDGAPANDSVSIYLRSTAVGTAKVMVF